MNTDVHHRTHCVVTVMSIISLKTCFKRLYVCMIYAMILLNIKRNEVK